MCSYEWKDVEFVEGGQGGMRDKMTCQVCREGCCLGCQEMWAKLPPTGRQRLQQGPASLSLKGDAEIRCQEC